MSTQMSEEQKRADSLATQREGAVLETNGDLFADRTNYAHCISADARMGAGIAKEFVRRFGAATFRERVREQKATVGQVAAVIHGDIYVYNLVTKERYSDKPTYDALRACLVAMLNHATANAVTRIAMPRIGCGLDKLEWGQVRAILDEVFDGSGVAIDVMFLDK